MSIESGPPIQMAVESAKPLEAKAPVFETSRLALTTFASGENLFTQLDPAQIANEGFFEEKGIKPDDKLIEAESERRKKAAEAVKVIRYAGEATKKENGSIYNESSGEYVLIGGDGAEIANGNLKDAYSGIRYKLQIIAAESSDPTVRKKAQNVLTAMDKFWGVSVNSELTLYSDWASKNGIDGKAQALSGMTPEAWGTADKDIQAIWRSKAETEVKMDLRIADESATQKKETPPEVKKEEPKPDEGEQAEYDKAENLAKTAFGKGEAVFGQQDPTRIAEEKFFKDKGIKPDDKIVEAEAERRKKAAQAARVFISAARAKGGENGSTLGDDGNYVLRGTNGQEIAKGNIRDAYPGMRYGLEIQAAEASDPAVRKETQDALAAMNKFWAVSEGDELVLHSDWAVKHDIDGKAQKVSGMTAEAWGTADPHVKAIWRGRAEMGEKMDLRVRTPKTGEDLKKEALETAHTEIYEIARSLIKLLWHRDISDPEIKLDEMKDGDPRLAVISALAINYRNAPAGSNARDFIGASLFSELRSFKIGELSVLPSLETSTGVNVRDLSGRMNTLSANSASLDEKSGELGNYINARIDSSAFAKEDKPVNISPHNRMRIMATAHAVRSEFGDKAIVRGTDGGLSLPQQVEVMIGNWRSDENIRFTADDRRAVMALATSNDIDNIYEGLLGFSSEHIKDRNRAINYYAEQAVAMIEDPNNRYDKTTKDRLTRAGKRHFIAAFDDIEKKFGWAGHAVNIGMVIALFMAPIQQVLEFDAKPSQQPE